MLAFCEINVGSVGVVGLIGGKPALPRPVMLSVIGIFLL